MSDKGTLGELAETGDFAGHLAGAALGVAWSRPMIRSGTSGSCSIWPGGGVHAAAATELGIGSAIATIYHPDQAGDSRLPRGIAATWRSRSAIPPTLVCLPRHRGRVVVTHWMRWFTTSAGEVATKMPSANDGRGA